MNNDGAIFIGTGWSECDGTFYITLAYILIFVSTYTVGDEVETPPTPLIDALFLWIPSRLDLSLMLATRTLVASNYKLTGSDRNHIL
jgi:hypothetical protein